MKYSLGSKQPSWTDLGKRSCRKGYSLHAKHVQPLNVSKLKELVAAGSKLEEELEAALVFLTSHKPYEATKCSGLRVTRLDREQLDKLLEVGKIERVTEEMERDCPTKAYCLLFTVPEDDKRRLRPIMHPEDVNKSLLRTVKVKFSTREQLHAPLRKKRLWAIHMDMAAWFDQLPISSKIRSYFRFRDADGNLYQSTRLPMGASHSVDVAHTIMKALVANLPSNVIVDIYVDNVRILGENKADVLEAAKMFARNAQSVGATVNELAGGGDVESLLTQGLAGQPEATFLGEEYDLSAGAVRASSKTLKKLDFSWSNRTNWTRKGLAAHYALLFYASATLRISPAGYFNAMRLLRRFSQTMTRQPGTWNWPVGEMLAPSAVAELEAWTRAVMRNEWQVQAHPPRPTKHIVCDASAWGFGAVCWNGRTAAVTQEPWNQEFTYGQRSAYAEPTAIYRAICQFVTPGEAAVIYTDHQAFPFAARAGYSHSYIINDILRKIAEGFGRDTISFVYIPGPSNPADYLSRNRLQTAVDAENLSRWQSGCGQWNHTGREDNGPWGLPPQYFLSS
jgi:hypothetical protein